jgi:hypothetical protein
MSATQLPLPRTGSSATDAARDLGYAHVGQSAAVNSTGRGRAEAGEEARCGTAPGAGRHLELHDELGWYRAAVFHFDALAPSQSRTCVVFMLRAAALRLFRAGFLVPGPSLAVLT